MLKKRIIPVQLLLDGRLVKTRQFGAYRDVGDPVASSRVYNAQNADELVFLNINRSTRDIDPLLKLLDRVSAVSFMPLSLGGGITSFESAARLIRSGADKVVVNSGVYRDYSLISKIADSFGSQAVVVGIDARGMSRKRTIRCTRTVVASQRACPWRHLGQAVAAGAGEILVNSIDRDGMMTGYDIPLLKRVSLACGSGDRVRRCRPLQSSQGCLSREQSQCAGVRQPVQLTDSNPIRAKAFSRLWSSFQGRLDDDGCGGREGNRRWRTHRRATVYLRLLEMSAAVERYLTWLRDPEVNRFLETRFGNRPI